MTQSAIDGPQFIDQLDEVLNHVRELLIEKRKKYGPITQMNIYSKLDVEEGLKARIDDKLRRKAQQSDDDEDTDLDLLGYLILLRVHRNSIPNSNTGGGDALQQEEGTLSA